jgi:hypothetical protein
MALSQSDLQNMGETQLKRRISLKFAIYLFLVTFYKITLCSNIPLPKVCSVTQKVNSRYEAKERKPRARK